MIPEYYEFSCPVKIISGRKALANLPYEMDLLGAHRAMVVTDRGVVEAGLIKRVESVFAGSPCVIGAVFDETPPDSSTAAVHRVAALFAEARCDCFVAVGGGSCLDTVKCANMLITEGLEDLAAFQGAERLTKPTKPFIAVPTTAGTGSEVSMVSVVYDEPTKAKLAFTSYRLYPHVAILDPEMTLTVPPYLTAATGMDALTHAVEAIYGLQRNPVSDAFAAAAIRLIVDHLCTCVRNGRDETARLALANGALLAGISFSNSMVGVVHSLAHACGAVCRTPHGVANAVLLPFGMEYNLAKAGDAVAGLAPLLRAPLSGEPMQQARAAIQAVRDLGKRLHDLCGLPTTLQEAGVPQERLEAVAKSAINDGAVTYNPEEITYDDALAFLQRAYA